MTYVATSIHWPRLVLGVFTAAVVALSVHSVMLQVLGIPFPDLSVIPIALKVVIRAVAMFGLLLLWELAALQSRGSFVGRWAVLFLITAALTETLFRGPFMEGYCTTAWTFAFVSNVQSLLTMATSCAIVVLSTSRLPRIWHKIAGAAGIALFTTFVVTPLIVAAMGPVMESIASLAPQSEWCTLPYGANVLIPAYLTFIEPSLGCLAAAALVWNQLSASRIVRYLQFTLLILAIKNQLLMPFVYASFAKTSFVDALVSESQFALEAIALAVLTGVAWECATGSTWRAEEPR